MSTGSERRITRRNVVAGMISTATAGWIHRVVPQDRPDLVLYDGDIRIVDRGMRRAAAIAIAGGRVLAVGSTAEIRRLAGPRAEAINLNGRTALPGANDSHLHALYWGFSLPPFNVDVS